MNKLFFRSSFILLSAALLVVSGFFVAVSPALAAAIVTPASEGTNISIDITSALGGSGTYKILSGPSITEIIAGDITVGTHTITLPTGWEFDTGFTINISAYGGDIVLGFTSITPDLTSFSFNVTSISTSASVLGFSNLKVRPTGTSPSTNNMTHSGGGIAGVVNGSTNFGTLSTVAGRVAKVAFTTQPGGAVYGSELSPQPVVKTQDQFGNDSTSGLGANKIVTLTLTGTGALQGAASLDIGTSAGNGIAAFTNLTVDAVGAKQLTAEATDLANAVSNSFDITPKTLTATITAISKIYDGSNSATFTNPTPVGAAFSDVLSLSGGFATFADANVGPGKTVTATGLILGGDNGGNYTYDGAATGMADITEKPITVTANAGQTKVYGEDDSVLTYTPSESLITGNSFTGALSRAGGGENVGRDDKKSTLYKRT